MSKGKYKTIQCMDCGRPVTRLVRSDKVRLCYDCSIKRVAQNANKQHLAKLSRMKKRREGITNGSNTRANR